MSAAGDIHMAPVAGEVLLELAELVLTSSHDSPVVHWQAVDTASDMSWDMCGSLQRVTVGPMGRLVFHVQCEISGREHKVPGEMITEWEWPA